MTVRMNLWSLTLIPGEPIPLYVNRDFQITNAALAEDLLSETGRSVVKVTHNPISQSAFEDDSEFDSDEDDESFEGPEGDDDEESEDSEEQEGEDDDDEDDEDDDEDMEEDSDDDEDDMEETSVLCSLTAGKCEQAVLNLTFVEGEVVIFEVSGENAVHLMGNYVNQFPADDYSDSDSEYESDDYDDLSLDDEDEFDVEEFDEEIEVAPKGKIELIEPAESKPAKQDKKRKAEEEAPAAEEQELSKSQKKKLAKKAKLEEAAAANVKKEKEAAPKKESKKVRK